MRHIIIALFLSISLCFVAGCPSPQPPAVEEERVGEFSVDLLLKLHNDARKDRSPLALDSHLCQYAQEHAEWMASRRNLKHSNIGKLLGKYSTVGENIACGQRSEREVTDDWMRSSGHRANIMNSRFTKVGFGIAVAKNGTVYWCTVFAN